MDGTPILQAIANYYEAKKELAASIFEWNQLDQEQRAQEQDVLRALIAAALGSAEG